MAALSAEFIGCFRFLQTHPTRDVRSKDLSRLDQRTQEAFSRTLLTLFGLRQAQIVQKRLDSSLGRDFVRLQRCCVEILQRPSASYSADSFPASRELIPGGVHEQTAFRTLQDFADILVLFPGQLDFCPERRKKIQAQRSKVLDILVPRTLKTTADQKKGELENALSILNFVEGGFAVNGQFFSYNDLFATWAYRSPERAALKETYPQFGLNSSGKRISGWSSESAESETFTGFLGRLATRLVRQAMNTQNLDPSTEAELQGRFLRENFNFVSPPFLEDDFISIQCLSWGALFYQNQSFTFADLVTTWSPNLDLFQAQGLELWKDTMAPTTIVDFQDFVKVSPTFKTFAIRCTIYAMEKNLEQEFSPAAKEFLLWFISQENRRSACGYYATDPHFFQMRFSGFPEDLRKLFYCLKHPDLFDLSCRCLEHMSVAVFRKEYSFLMKEQCFIDLLVFLVSQPGKIEQWSLLFEKSAGHKSVQLMPTQLLAFCETNKNLASGALSELIKASEEVFTYIEVVSPTAPLGGLFFVPPVSIAEHERTLKLALDRSEAFFKIVANHSSFPPENLIRLLRFFVFNPHFYFLELIYNEKEILGCPDIESPLLLEILLIPPEKFAACDQGDRNQAVSTALRTFQEKYQLPLKNLFFLFWQMLHSIYTDGQLLEWTTRDSLIEELSGHFFALSGPAICGLFLSTERMTKQDIQDLVQIKKTWITEHLATRRFTLPPSSLDYVRTAFQPFCHRIAAGLGLPPGERGPFEDALETSFRNSLYPQYQPLTDFCRLKGFSNEQPIWEADHLHTRCKALIPIQGSSRTVYLRWDFYNEVPCIFVSFFNLKTEEAFSFFIAFGIDLKETGKPLLDKLFPYLSILAQAVFEEPPGTAHRTSIFEDDNDDHQRQAYCLMKQKKEQAFNRETEDFLWNFLRQAKLLFREGWVRGEDLLYENLLPVDHEQAARGHIYRSSDTGMSLIPPDRLLVATTPDFYTSQMSDEFAQAAFERLPKKIPMSLQVSVTEDGINPIPLLLTIDVQTAEERSLDEEDEKEDTFQLRPKTADPTQEMVYFVTINGVTLQYSTQMKFAEFKKQLEFHILQVKTRFYQELNPTGDEPTTLLPEKVVVENDEFVIVLPQSDGPPQSGDPLPSPRRDTSASKSHAFGSERDPVLALLDDLA